MNYLPSPVLLNAYALAAAAIESPAGTDIKTRSYLQTGLCVWPNTRRIDCIKSFDSERSVSQQPENSNEETINFSTDFPRLKSRACLF